MKPYLIAGFLLISVLFVLGTATAEEPNATKQVEPEAVTQPTDSNAAADANAPQDPNAAAGEPNEALAREKEILADKLGKVFKEGEKEIREWTRRSIPNRADLADTVYENVQKEFEAIKRIAASEDATQTVMAIEMLLEDRQQRLEAMTELLNEMQEKERQREERQERRDRARRSSRRDRE